MLYCLHLVEMFLSDVYYGDCGEIHDGSNKGLVKNHPCSDAGFTFSCVKVLDGIERGIAGLFH